jgi:hypothetical protein
MRNIKVLMLKFNDMESKDLGSKKMNNKQEHNEDFSGKDISHKPKTIVTKLEKEEVTDADGNKKVVERARKVDGSSVAISPKKIIELDDSESSSRGVSTEKEAKKTVENIDRNSDITPNRYPNSNPDNRKNRGNNKLDE